MHSGLPVNDAFIRDEKKHEETRDRCTRDVEQLLDLTDVYSNENETNMRRILCCQGLEPVPRLRSSTSSRVCSRLPLLYAAVKVDSVSTREYVHCTVWENPVDDITHGTGNYVTGTA